MRAGSLAQKQANFGLTRMQPYLSGCLTVLLLVVGCWLLVDLAPLARLLVLLDLFGLRGDDVAKIAAVARSLTCSAHSTSTRKISHYR